MASLTFGIMQTAVRDDTVSVEEYLAAQEASEVRHEYLGGLVYAMAGETREHNQIVGNLYLLIRNHLRDKRYRAFISDIRVNLNLNRDDYYYFPDIVMTCDPRDTHPRFVRYPKLIVEVLSPSTERIDKREKLFAYTTVESLEEYVLVGQDPREVTFYRRANEWRSEKVSGAEAKVAFRSLDLTVPAAAFYEGL
jgi:Uma2 family endonuclease